MAEQTGQHGYLFRFDKVITTALHMLLGCISERYISVKVLVEDRRDSRSVRFQVVFILP